MATDMNRVILIGRLVKDPDLKATNGGTSICNFSIANNRTYVSGGEKKEQVSYFNCLAWGRSGEVINQYMKKGHKIGIDGHLQQRSWDDNDGNKHYVVEVVIENFQFLNDKNSGSSTADKVKDQFSGKEITEDDIPF